MDDEVGERSYIQCSPPGTNEYSIVIMQRFSTSDNHQELGSNLKMLSDLGLNPYLAFSDDPGRDESLLCKIFSNLRIGNEETTVEKIVPADLTAMTTQKNYFICSQSTGGP